MYVTHMGVINTKLLWWLTRGGGATGEGEEEIPAAL